HLVFDLVFHPGADNLEGWAIDVDRLPLALGAAFDLDAEFVLARIQVVGEGELGTMPGLAAERHLARLDIPETAGLSVVVGSQARRGLVGVVDIGGDFRFLRAGLSARFNADVHVQRFGLQLRRALGRLAAADDLDGDVPRRDGGTARGSIRIPEAVSLKTATLPFAGAET